MFKFEYWCRTRWWEGLAAPEEFQAGKFAVV